MKKSVKLICLFFVFLFTISCCYPAKRIAYYTNKKNYITTKGTITSITFNATTSDENAKEEENASETIPEPEKEPENEPEKEEKEGPSYIAITILKSFLKT